MWNAYIAPIHISLYFDSFYNTNIDLLRETHSIGIIEYACATTSLFYLLVVFHTFKVTE